MKLRTAYGLKEKMNDGRKLTLLLDWQYLTATEAKIAVAQVKQVLHTLLGEQEMLFASVYRNGDMIRFYKNISWKPKSDMHEEWKGFVRTDESEFVQKKRVKKMLREDATDHTFRNIRIATNPFFALDREKANAMVRERLGTELQEYSMHDAQEEAEFFFSQRYAIDGSYRIKASISISGYAIGYALQALAEEYKAQLLAVSEKTPLFAGYIFYETKPTCAYDYFHSNPSKIRGAKRKTFGLIGYEWAAYINKELAKELSAEKLEQLRQFADVSTEQNGIYYQTRCEIQKFGRAEKKRCRAIFGDLLQPGYGYISLADLCTEQMQLDEATVYLLQSKGEGRSQFYDLGFYSGTTPEESWTNYVFQVLEEIKIS